jgi:hypothetical protein
MHRCGIAWAFVVLAAALAVADRASADGGDVECLLAGVSRIGAPGIPGPLCVFGDGAFPVVAGGAGAKACEPVVAAGRLGAGRVVAFGHPGYFDLKALESPDTGRLMANAVRWAGGAKAEPAGLAVAIRGQKGLLEFLRKQGFAAQALDDAGWPAKLASAKVLCIDPSSAGDADLAAVARFVGDGGGLVAAGLGWGWLQLHPGKTLLADHSGNRLLAPAGIVWADGTLHPTADGGYAAGSAPPPLAHAARALDAVVAQADGKAPLARDEAVQACATLSRAARSLPPGDALLLPRLRRLRRERAAAAVPSPEKPLRADRALDRLVLALDLEETKHLAADKVKAHPAAAAFPGAVPADAPRVERTVLVRTSVPGWHSTGLYAAPGEAVAVAVPEAAAGKGLAVRIGAHSDGLGGLATWRRCPEIVRTFPLAAAVTRAANAFGGLIYIDVSGRPGLGAVEVRIGGAVEAPLFVLGKTAADEWRRQVRIRPGPWAELATDKVILTVPSKVVRGLDDPEDLMKFWDRVLDACAELAGRPTERSRPERYVADVQISAGYMHSGYPIMVLLDMPEVMVDKARLMANGHGGVWGLFHELGHNHQAGDWTFDGAGEVTENLFSLYVMEKACGLPPLSGHGAVTPKARAKAVAAYFAAGPDFARWKQDPFLGLEMYMQLQEAFGWDAYRKVLAEYRGLGPAERPKGDAEKRDQWMVRFSRAVGRNLGPFFQAWAVPTSDKARASVADLPAWMPEGFPQKKQVL